MKQFGHISYLLIICSILLFACLNPTPDSEMPDGKIKFVNNSNLSIFYLGGFYLENDLDTLIDFGRPANSTIDKFSINSNSYNEEMIYIEEFQYLLKTHLRSYFFFNKDSIKKYPWDTIVKRNMVLKRVTINNWQQLVDSNFTITYP